MNSDIKIGLISLGCPKNEVDAEVMLHRINEAGYKVEEDPKECDVIIVNTCGFIESAKKEAIDTIFEVSDLKENGKLKKLIVSGCFSGRYKDIVLDEMPEVDAVLGISQYPDIVNHIKRTLANERFVETYLDESLSGVSGRILTTAPQKAYLKIAEGCSNRCAYCAIPLIRGNMRSRSLDEIMDEAKLLISQGVKEITLVAQDTTRYGLDINTNFATLLKKLAKLDENVWFRVLYMYPEMIDDELIDVFKEHDNICKYMDIPLQHASNKILRAMNRHSTKEGIIAMYKNLKAKLPNITLRTTYITGFPGETQEDFDELIKFIHDYPFDHVGAFAFSPEEDTPAFDMDYAVEDDVKEERKDLLLQYQSELSLNFMKAKIGNTYKVLLEDNQDGSYFGRSQDFASEIDGEIEIITDKELIIGEFYNVTITEATQYDLVGKLGD